MTRETRLESLLTELLDRLQRFIDRANANDGLDIMAVSMRATVQSAAQYLFENGLTADARRLKDAADRLLHEVMGIALHDVAKKLPTEENESRIEFYDLSLLTEDDPETREYRLRGIVGSAVQLRDLVEEILADIKAHGRQPRRKRSAERGDVHDKPHPSGVADDPTKRKPSGTVELKDWAIGVEDGKTWWLFRKKQSHWEQFGNVPIPQGHAQKLANELVMGGGAISRTEACKLLRRDYAGMSDQEIQRRVVKHAMHKLRSAIRNRIKDAAGYSKVTDPIPWDRINSGWQARVNFGLAVQDDNKRIAFKTRTELTTDERIDANHAGTVARNSD